MTHYNTPAPAASNVAGAGFPASVHQGRFPHIKSSAFSSVDFSVNAALAALANAVDGLTFNANALVCSPLSDMGNAVAAVSAAAEVVHHAQAHVFATLAGVPAATPGFASACQIFPKISRSSLIFLTVDVTTANASAANSSPPTPTPAPAPGTAGPAAFLRSSEPWLAGYLFNVVPAAPLSPIPDNGNKWFAITRGKYVGLTKNSAISLNAVTGVSTGLSDKFTTQDDALEHFNAALQSGAIAILG
ncbi:hypothetical protein C8R47DRAFT_1062604 [Mycena vitilis]|nr:hypothetical protein C8R47DRAFT_1062604 [Mycena vitilis]